MATIGTGISTSGLASTPLPGAAWARRRSPGEYQVKLALTSAIQLDLTVSAHNLKHLVSHLLEIENLIDDDFQTWRDELTGLEAFRGMTPAAPPTRAAGGNRSTNPRSNTPT